MPIYAYRCEHCGFQKDVLQRMSDPLLVTCPSCGEPTFRKQVTAAGFQLKGSGWYVTDFRNPATKEASKKSTDESSGAAKADADSGDKKTPASTDSAPAPAPTPAPAAKSETTPAKPSSSGSDSN